MQGLALLSESRIRHLTCIIKMDRKQDLLTGLGQLVKKLLNAQYIYESDKKRIALRLCAKKKTEEEILACYRLCWQMELVFKRLKSLLQSGNIPTKTKESVEVWINGKILLSLLTEKYLGDIDFSTSWNIWREPEYMEESKLASFMIFMIILTNRSEMSIEILEFIKMSFIEKRRKTRQQLIQFLLS